MKALIPVVGILAIVVLLIFKTINLLFSLRNGGVAANWRIYIYQMGLSRSSLIPYELIKNCLMRSMMQSGTRTARKKSLPMLWLCNSLKNMVPEAGVEPAT